MEEKLYKELRDSINELREKLNVINIGSVRGPIADPIPPFAYLYPHNSLEYLRHLSDPIRIRGPISDPVPDINIMKSIGQIADPLPPIQTQLLEKSRLAKIRIHQLEQLTDDYKKHIDLIGLEIKMLKEEYK